MTRREEVSGLMIADIVLDADVPISTCGRTNNVP